MKKKIFLIGLMAGILAMSVGCGKETTAPVNEEERQTESKQSAVQEIENSDQDPIEQMVNQSESRCFPVTRGNYPNYALWEEVLALPEIGSYDISGSIADTVLEDAPELTLYADTISDREGRGTYGTMVITGEDLTSEDAGKCLVPDSYIESSGKKIGDKIVLKTQKGEKEYSIAGSYSYDDDSPFIENSILIPMPDFMECADLSKENQIMVESVTCESISVRDEFIKKANAILKDNGTMFKAEEDFAVETDNDSVSTEANTAKTIAADGIMLEDVSEIDNILLKDGITMLNLWTTFCNYCIDEMPVLDQLGSAYRQEGYPLQIIGVCCDAQDKDGAIDQGQLELAKEIVEKTGIEYTNILPGENLRKKFTYDISVFPTTVFLDGQGNIIKTVVGERTMKEWKETIDEVLEVL